MLAVDPFVQDWVAATNGRLYRDLIGKLTSYPVPPWPGPMPRSSGSLVLDIGCGWGRWMLSSAAAGYVPIGIDVKLEALQAARRVLKANGRSGFVVAADLKRLPFKPNTFNMVFSYSVLQHTHRLRVTSCIADVHRVLAADGACLLQFPLSHGIGNALRHLPGQPEEDDYESWCVRYYSMAELKTLFGRAFHDCQFQTDCYFGIGVQGSDLGLLPLKYKAIVVMSETLKSLASVVPPLRRLADSVYVIARKDKIASSDCPDGFNVADAGNNLNVLRYLQCPVSGGDLELSPAGNELISKSARLAFPVVNEIPVLIADDARSL